MTGDKYWAAKVSYTKNTSNCNTIIQYLVTTPSQELPSMAVILDNKYTMHKLKTWQAVFRLNLIGSRWQSYPAHNTNSPPYPCYIVTANSSNWQCIVSACNCLKAVQILLFTCIWYIWPCYKFMIWYRMV